jgi:hypothetical protein
LSIITDNADKNISSDVELSFKIIVDELLENEDLRISICRSNLKDDDKLKLIGCLSRSCATSARFHASRFLKVLVERQNNVTFK